MLQSLHIQNIAIIEKLDVEFGPGLNVMTGETGAGKTILLAAINLLLGSRASTDLIRSGEDKASVIASFSLERASDEFRTALEGHGIDAQDELIVHRLMTVAGKGKVTLNGIPISQSVLREIGASLVDPAGQHEHQRLMDVQFHLRILDTYGRYENELQRYHTQYDLYAGAKAELSQLRDQESISKEKLDWLKFQLTELEAANLRLGEDDEIEIIRGRAKHAVTLLSRIQEAAGLLSADGGAAALLDKACRAVASCESFDGNLSRYRECLERSAIELAEMERDLSHYADGVNADPSQLEALEDRLYQLRGLMKKYGGSLAACIEKQEALKKEIDTIVRYDDVVAELETQVEVHGKSLRVAAERLSAMRRKAADVLATAVLAELSDLAMNKTRFEVRVQTKPFEGWTAAGPDDIEFLISPNPGEELRPLRQIASGGELARILLAIKRSLADNRNDVGIAIFDEVDSGVGGAVAHAVGRKLKAMSVHRQVICITHQPQVAAHGDHHFRISKKTAKGRTATTVSALSTEERVEEIARMLSGEALSQTARQHAVELLAKK
ncbi:MAG: DNA repair protein RecN [Deltaproteobacteria bacterium]|nr:DNA repair protein RecN [Deltaproteobacteria bacterium]